MDNWFVDSESVQFIGDTCLIQYQINEGEIILHDVMGTQGNITCKLLENMMEGRVVGFNLTHDFFHLSRTYNLCKLLGHEKPEKDLDYWHSLFNHEHARKYCLLPKEAVDLMLVGKRGKFQALIRQKPIRIKKVPIILADKLISELEDRVVLNPLYFAGFKEGKQWKKKYLYKVGHEKVHIEIKQGDEQYKSDVFCNVILPFKPKKTLKAIMKHIFDFNVKEYNVAFTKNIQECFWNPNDIKWKSIYYSHVNMWREMKSQRDYARDDVKYTKHLYEYFDKPSEDVDSLLACMSGNLYWKGYDIDLKIVAREYTKLYPTVKKDLDLVDFKSPIKSLEYLIKDKPLYKKIILDTKTETLESLIKSQVKELTERASTIYEGRRAFKRLTLLERFLKAKKMYCQFQIGGTATNRKSGGNPEGKGQSINPQGIPRELSFREIFTFHEFGKGWSMSGGDADSFEVSIAARVFEDKGLTEKLMKGKKFHAIFGSFMYNKTYEEIMETNELEGNENLYALSKTGVFAWFYGGTEHTIAEHLNLPEESITEAMSLLEKEHPGIRKSRERVEELFGALHQPGGLGTKVIWQNTEKKIKSFMGFERDFTANLECSRAIFDLASKMPEELKELGKGTNVLRNEAKGKQTAFGALMSALYASAFMLVSDVKKIALNFTIQSPGAEIIKNMEFRLIDTFQPRGVKEYNICPMNMHDEIVIGHKKELGDSIEKTIKNFVKEYKKHVPLFKVSWKKNKKNWAETH